MKNKILVILLALSMALTILFLGLWRTEANDHEACIQSICQESIEDAKNAFLDYSKSKQEISYWHGVSCFYTFMCAYQQLPDATGDYMAIQAEAHLQMLHNSNKCMSNIEQLVEVMQLLAENYNDFISERALANLF